MPNGKSHPNDQRPLVVVVAKGLNGDGEGPPLRIDSFAKNLALVDDDLPGPLDARDGHEGVALAPEKRPILLVQLPGRELECDEVVCCVGFFRAD